MTSESSEDGSGTAAGSPGPAGGRRGPTAAAAAPSIDSRSTLKFVLRLGFGVGLLVLFANVVDFRGALAAIGDMPPAIGAAAFVVGVTGSIIVPAVITRHTLEAAGLELRLGELVLINFGMRFYVLLLPHAVSVGLRWRRYAAEPGTGWHAATLILFERLIQLLMLVAAAFAFLVAAWPTVPEGLRVLLPLSGLASLVVVGVVVLFLSARVYRLATPLIEWLIGHSPGFIARRGEHLQAAVRDYQTLRRTHVVAVLAWAAVGHLLFVLSAWLVGLGLDIDLSFASIGWMRSAVFLVTVLPITVGGLGVREVGFATLLRLQGVDPVEAASFPLVLLAIQLGIGAVGATFEAVRAVRGVGHG